MMITTVHSLFVLLVTVLLSLQTFTEAFQISTNGRHSVSSSRSTSSASPPSSHMTRTTESTQLYNLFGNLFGQKEDAGNNNGVGRAAPIADVMEIPTKVIKTKPLKFFLQIFFVGIQNEPFKGAWLLNANEEVEEYLEVYFADGSGMLSVQFDDDYGLRIQRKGQRPSLQYMLQESVLLHSVLDELESIAFGNGDNGDVKDEERLLQFAEGDEDVLARARAKLPARAAPAE